MITFELRTSPGMNVREHWAVRSKRVRSERHATAWALSRHERPRLPCTVRLTRVAPSNGLDDDNLCSSLKGVRDQVAQWLGVDDRHRERVRYVYAQVRGPWAVRIEWLPAMAGAQLEIAA
jgi:hypothetical protein